MLLFFLHSVIYLLPSVLSLENIIETPCGRINGISVLFENDTVFQFRNIPYAKPPLGDLRFRKPEPYGSWSGLRDGTEFGPSCIQDMRYNKEKSLENRNMSEDCLSLNVYVPHTLANITNTNKSVMIWIYGGSYIIGQGELYDASALASVGNVLVVTVNYRLGILGFLSTGDQASRGNYGLWDQHLAIRWVKDNIASFGGNSDSITIFGESAGGFGVTYQSLALQNKGLFQRVIAQSGVSNSRLSYSVDANAFAKLYSSHLPCKNTSRSITNEEIVSCLREMSPETLLSEQAYFLLPEDRAQFTLNPAVVVDGEFVVDFPDKLIKDKTSESYKMFKSLDYIAGNCNNEGSIIVPMIHQYGEILRFNSSQGLPSSVVCVELIPGLLADLYRINTLNNIASIEICNKYKRADMGEQAQQLTNMYSDVFFFAPVVESLLAHSVNNDFTNTYQYMFNVPDIFKQGLETPPWFQGSSHGSEIIFLFGLQDEPIVYQTPGTQNYLNLSGIMLKYWTNFAKTGNPNGAGLPYWSKFDGHNRSYINLDIPITPGSALYADRVNFWLINIPRIVQQMFNFPSVIG